MKRKRILTQFLLYVLMFMFLIVAGCSDSDDDDNDDDQNTNTTVTISGTVTDKTTGNPISNVIMSAMIRVEVLNINLWEGSIDSDRFSFIMTKSDGTYSLTVPAGLIENYTLILTPAKTGYTFSPTEKAITIADVDQTGINFTATKESQFSREDLGGIWRVNMLRAGADQWMRARISVDSTSGEASCLSYETSDSAGDTTCPDPFELTLTIDDEGIVTQSGNHATASHMTMSSNEQFMAGIAGTRNYQMTIAQKEPTNLTRYTAADIQDKDFVFHSLSVGGTNEWRYGSGYADEAGLIVQDAGSEFSSGTAGETLAGLTVAVEPGTGVVTIAEIPTFQGFLSADEKTIVGTSGEAVTGADGTYSLMVIQIPIEGTSTFTGSSVNHLLGVGDDTNAWAYYDVNVSRLETTFLQGILDLTFAVNLMLSYNWEFSANLDYTNAEKLLFTDIEKLNIGSTGEATITNPETDAIIFHGQLGYLGKFMVGVETLTLDVDGTSTDFYTLNVITH